MWKVVGLLCGIVMVARSQETTAVNQCMNHAGELPINTHVEGCITPPCFLPQLQDVVVHIIFRAPYTMRSMKTLATAYLVGTIGIDYGLGEQEVTCNFLQNTYCPVLKDEVIVYTLRMYIAPEFPRGLPVTIEFRIVDSEEKEVICIRVPVRITNPITPNAGQQNGTLPINTDN